MLEVSAASVMNILAGARGLLVAEGRTLCSFSPCFALRTIYRIHSKSSPGCQARSSRKMVFTWDPSCVIGITIRAGDAHFSKKLCIIVQGHAFSSESYGRLCSLHFVHRASLQRQTVLARWFSRNNEKASTAITPAFMPDSPAAWCVLCANLSLIHTVHLSAYQLWPNLICDVLSLNSLEWGFEHCRETLCAVVYKLLSARR